MSSNNNITDPTYNPLTNSLATSAGLSISELLALDSAKSGVAPGKAICYEMQKHNGYLNAAAIADGTDISISIAGTGAVAGDILEVFIDGELMPSASHVLLAGEISNATSANIGTKSDAGVGAVPISAERLAMLSQGDLHKVTSRIHYVGTDTYSEISSAVGYLRIDTKAPSTPVVPVATDDVGETTGLIAQGDVTDDASPLVSGTASEITNTIDVYDNGVLLGKATVQSNGKWSFTPTPPLLDGPHAITIIETDKAGNPSPMSPPMNFVVDTGTTTVVIANAEDNAGDIQGNVANGGVTDDTTPTLVGTAKANAVVTIREGNNVVGTTTADALGHWSFTPTGVQSEGKHTYTASITVAGNTVTSAGFVITVDTTAPDVTVTPQGDNFKTAAEATDPAGIITVTSEADSVSTVTFHGVKGDVVKTITNNGTAKPVVLTAADLATLGDGAVEVTTVTKDKAGNTITTPDGNDGDFILDTVAATVVVTPQGDNLKTAAEATDPAGIITVTSEADSVSTVTFQGVKGKVTKTIANDGTAKPVQLSAADLATLGDGAVEVTTVTKDKAGNTTTTADINDGDFILDTTPPDVTVTPQGAVIKTAAEATSTGGIITVTSEADSVSTVTFHGMKGDVVKTIANDGTAKPVQLTAADLATLGDGAVEVTTVTKDKAGNTITTADVNDGDFILDTTPSNITGDTGKTTDETDVAQIITGNLTSVDVHGSPNTFQAIAGVTGTGGYGSFSMNTAGKWTYTMNGPHNEFVLGQSYTDSFTATAADGSTKLITVTINGTNDAAVITGARAGQNPRATAHHLARGRSCALH
jgi:VCBS repeat-containing protein